MVLDTSALLVILLDEAESPAFRQAIEEDRVRLLSAASLLEAALVLEARFGEPGGRELDLLLHKAEVQVVAVDRDQAELGREAYRRFGKGRHPAGLDFGDCFSYALSVISGEPLLYKGADFSLTDVTPVLRG
jgi:ribonuclease VapC